MDSVSGKSLIVLGGHAVGTVFNFLWKFGMKIPIIRSFLRALSSLHGKILSIYRDVTPGIKVFTVLTGNTLGSHESFWKLLANQFNLEKVPSVEDCDVILAFCPIVSRVGTDIGAALSVIPECRPAVLVVFHHTNDKHYIIPNTSRFAQDRKIPTVDCLFNDGGLLQTQQNDKAFRHAMECLKPFQKNETGWLLRLIRLPLSVALNALRRLRQH